ncbi:helix-turn-helix domain-containing protein [Microbacterium marinilacus]|uniref:Helix-turn-helix domain-containing protein n=1 Tax=Microbacterium marinilacus TaxID=415209 RepID=A0ABP7BLY8_9MICO|nr:helix-turn-helix domain-containing protein [Microbacterium marinilacus]MBY0690048.1 helix-turn-helix domain-containing protein [Microbacterium marinilacus]
MDGRWITTGAAADLLGRSRQHVVDLCDRGVLPHARAGTHRRVDREAVERLLEPTMTYEQTRSLWLHRAVVGKLVLEPDRVLEKASENIARWRGRHRPDGKAVQYLDEWEQLISDGVEAVAKVLVDTGERARELRQNSPFAGVLSDRQRTQILDSFRADWDRHRRKPAA